MLVTFFFLLALAYSQELVIYSQKVGQVLKTEYGRISLDADSPTASFLLTTAPENGSFCLGTCDLPGKECFAYQETDAPLSGEFRVYVKDGKIDDLSFASSNRGSDLGGSDLSGSALNGGSGSNGVSVVAVNSGVGPLPNLKPVAKPMVQQPNTKKVVRKRVVENEQGEKVEVEEEIEEVVDPRSWIQKNWMYVVPPLVLFLIMSPEK